MRWKQNLTFNNDDGKNCTQKTIYIKKIKKFNYYYHPSPPAFSFSSSLSENRNKIAKKMYYRWIHYAVSECTTHEYIMQFRTDSA